MYHNLMQLPMPAFPRRTVWITILLGFLLRLWFNLIQHPLGQFLFSDMAVYDHRAQHLLHGPLTAWDSFTPVGYPALVALIYALTGGSTAAVGFLHAVLGAFTCYLAARVSWRLSENPRLAASVCILMAAYLPFVSYGGLLMSETLSAFLAPASVLLLIRARESPTLGRLSAAGLALSASVVVRPYLALLYPLLGIYFTAAFRPDFRRALRAFSLVVLASLPFFAAAASHNSRLVGRFNLFGTNGGLNFFLAHSEYRTAESRKNPNDKTPDYSITPIPNSWRNKGVFNAPVPLYDDAFFYRKALELIAEHPLRLVRDLRNIKEGLGLGRTRYWPGWQKTWWLLEPFNKAFFWLIGLPGLGLLAYLLGKGRLFRPENSDRLLIGLFWVMTLATLYLFLGDPRVRVPFDPIFAALAADFWLRLKGRIIRP